ncbi:MAG: polyphosphate kinase 2 [Halobacteriovoraceae bacterium]|nr:polyphosphate kinase 2 [Halobacteriovoraceae bacterium]
MSTQETTDFIRNLGKKGEEVVFDYFLEKKFIDEKTAKIIREGSKKETIDPTYPYKDKICRKEYESLKHDLQVELIKWQNTIKDSGQKVVVLFEGRDAAGKGGAIKRFTEHLNPRGARVVALNRPTPEEMGQWYFQRYVKHFPTTGEIVFFDRSWYNRAGVEKVMNYCSSEEYIRFSNSVSNFEQMISNSGVKLIKFWFSVSREEQLRRFMARIVDPLKRWKISPTDIASLQLWKDYTQAKESMFNISDSDQNPWMIVRADDKKRARINAMRYVLHQFNYEGKDAEKIQPVDHKILGRPENFLKLGK